MPINLLTARGGLKVNIPLDPAEIARLDTRRVSTVTLHVRLDERIVVITELRVVSIRRVQGSIAEFGLDRVTVALHGRLAPGGVILEAGLWAQVKTPRPMAAAA
jgi:hypothetical protein